MAVFKCKMCGGALEVDGNLTTTTCDYCGSQQTLPRLNDDKLERLYDRANHFRLNNEFDKALGIYEQILDETSEDAEVYWSIVLCRYGIEYVEDPKTGKRTPTVNRAQLIPISADSDYALAIKHADVSQKILYESEAKAIDEILEGIFTFSRQEEAFDVFLSYKETDDTTGKRTDDSLVALEVFYLPLIKKGYNVFYAPMTLKEKHIPKGKYDSYIFSALSSAKVMIVIGSKEEYFQAEWVKNEWGRYLNRIVKNNEDKDIIPVYRNISPSQLPEKLRSFEAFDLAKPDTLFYVMQKIEHIIPSKTSQAPSKAGEKASGSDAPSYNSASNGGDTEALLKRVALFLDGGDWGNADIYCEKVLDIDPENTSAYISKLMAQMRVTKEEDLALGHTPLEGMLPYKNALRFADEATAARLIQYNSKIKENAAKRDRERLEREKKEESERQERARIEREHRQQAEKKQKEMNALQTARNNAAGLISSQIKEKERLEGLIAKKQADLIASGNPKKLRALSISVLLLAFISLISLIMVVNEPDSVVGILLIVVGVILFLVFSALLLHAKGKSVALVLLNFVTYGIFSVVLAIITLNKTKKSQVNQSAQEIFALNNQLKQVEAKIDNTRRSLSEINQKIESHRQ